MHYNISTVGLCAAKVAVRNTVRLLSYTKGGKHLGVVDVYTKIPYDLSGSISKNRFRQELCWGISKMFDLFDKEDFCVVFDYKCDIEIHFNDSIEFYQIKTHKIQSPYKFSNLKRHKDGPSIIAKLFVLKDTSSPDVPIRCAIVSNAFLQIGKVAISDKESFSFEELDEKSQSAVKAALTEELVRENVDLSNLYYIYTPMNLFAPQNDIIGKITGSFERIKGCEPVKPNALYRLIVDTVTEKACYELSSQDSAVYNYLLYFVDQDYQNGSQFASFQHLGEYLDYKENVLYYHFGAFDDDYYMLVQEQDILLAEGRRLENEHKMTCMMLDKIYANIHKR